MTPSALSNIFKSAQFINLRCGRMFSCSMSGDVYRGIRVAARVAKSPSRPPYMIVSYKGYTRHRIWHKLGNPTRATGQ